MLFVQIEEIWNRDVHFVVAPNQVGSGLLLFLLDSLGVLVELNSLLDWVRDCLEYFFLVAPQHSFFHNFKAVHSLEFAWSDLHRHAQLWNNHGFYSLLLFVLKSDPNICGILYIINFGVSEKYVQVSTPKIHKE